MSHTVFWPSSLPIYQKPNTSKPAKGHKTYASLLGGLRIDRPNQVWCADTSCLPLPKGFCYLVAIMDWFARRALAWRNSTTLEAGVCLEAMTEAIHKFGPPEIMTADQGSQFTSFDGTDRLMRVGKQLREQMQLELRSLQQKLGIPFVLVTHDQEEALTLSDRVAVVSQGQVVQVDTPNGLCDNPRSRLVAGFVGTLHFFDGMVRRNGADAALDVEGLGRVDQNGHAGQFQEDDNATVALRPGGFTLHHHRPASATRIVQRTLQTRPYLGGRQMLHVWIDDRSAPVAILQQSARGKDADKIANGSPIWLTW